MNETLSVLVRDHEGLAILAQVLNPAGGVTTFLLPPYQYGASVQVVGEPRDTQELERLRRL